MIVPDGRNIHSLKAFFEAYPYLKSSELAQLANVPLRRILRWRKRCGLTSRGHGWGTKHDERPFVGKAPEPVVVEMVLDPKIWDNREWFEEQFKKGYGRKIISRIIGKSDGCINIRLRRYQIKPQKVCSKNPCCTKQWLEEHYEVLGLGINKCAALAGVSNYTIYHWLVKYGIHIRDRYECHLGRVVTKKSRVIMVNVPQ